MLGFDPRDLGMCGSTIRLPFFSFHVLSSLHVKTLVALNNQCHTLGKNGTPLEGF
jgi:hypothetical protein